MQAFLPPPPHQIHHAAYCKVACPSNDNHILPGIRSMKYIVYGSMLEFADSKASCSNSSLTGIEPGNQEKLTNLIVGQNCT